MHKTLYLTIDFLEKGFNLAPKNATHLSNIAVQGVCPHVGIDGAIGVGALPRDSRPHVLKLKEGQNILVKNINPYFHI